MENLFIILTLVCMVTSCGDIKHNTDGSTEYIYYYADNSIKKQKHIIKDENGETVEYWKFYYQNGNLKKEGETINNNSQGLWLFYYDSGAIKSKTKFNNDIRSGESFYYWENGQLQGTGIYKNDLIEGLWTAYHENGQKDREGLMINGKEDGTWKAWTENGELFVMGEYTMGELISEEYQ